MHILAPHILVPTVLVLMGLLLLWIALTGKTVYYPKSNPPIPIPRTLGRLLSGFMGLAALFIAIWGLLHQR